MQIALPVAQGVRTDHPDPTLPLVDDSHIPIHDGEAIEALGRRHADDWTWGRYDADGDRWSAFTTDQRNPRYGWVVTSAPGFGRNVLLYTNDGAHTAYKPPQHSGHALLYRAGGYWWDGTQWNRPERVWDQLEERFVRNRVAHSAPLDASTYLARQAQLSKSAVARVGVTDVEQFEHDLTGLIWRPDEQAANVAAWAALRSGDDLLPEQCIVGIDAPELDRDATVDERGAARELGMKLSEFRDLTTGEPDNREFPAPQLPGLRSGGCRWSLPVLRQWAWQHRREQVDQLIPDSEASSPFPRGHDLEGALHCIAQAAVADIYVSSIRDYPRPTTQVPTERALRWVLHSGTRRLGVLLADIIRMAGEDPWNLDREYVVAGLREAMTFAGEGLDFDLRQEILELTLPPSITGYMPE